MKNAVYEVSEVHPHVSRPQAFAFISITLVHTALAGVPTVKLGILWFAPRALTSRRIHIVPPGALCFTSLCLHLWQLSHFFWPKLSFHGIWSVPLMRFIITASKQTYESLTARVNNKPVFYLGVSIHFKWTEMSRVKVHCSNHFTLKAVITENNCHFCNASMASGIQSCLS